MKQYSQKGAALFIVLIMLLVITIIGVSSMNDTLMQGKMSGAVQDSNVALQGVDTAVREAEAYLDSVTGSAHFNNTNGLYDIGAGPDCCTATTWSSTNSRAATKTAGLAVAPRYIIEEMGEVAGDTSGEYFATIENSDIGNTQNLGTITAYRIVARSTGASGNSQRIVESYYGEME